MMTPTTALNRFASERRKHDLYLNESRVNLYHGFRIGDLKFLLRPEVKVEVVETTPCCPVPNTPGWLSGMLNLRGEIFPVFDINFLITKNAELSRWIMVFRHAGHSAGIYIDTLPVGITPGTVVNEQINLPEILQGCVDNIYIQGDDRWIETDFEKLFLKLRDLF